MIVLALLRLLLLAALAVAGAWVARLLFGAAGRGRATRTRPREVQRTMVRDRVCNSFLPQDRALEFRLGGQTYFFCSEACRHRFLQEAGVAEST